MYTAPFKGTIDFADIFFGGFRVSLISIHGMFPTFSIIRVSIVGFLLNTGPHFKFLF